MIGMSQIKKKFISGILIGAVVGIVGIIITVVLSMNMVNGYKNGTNKDFINTYTSSVVIFTRDVLQGETITPDMLQTTRVHNTTIPQDAIIYIDEVIGQVAKYNIAYGSPAVRSMFGKEILTGDIRIQEINSVVLPTDLVEGEYIDIRIMYPSGIEYIVLAQKKVSKIYGTTIWMDMSEADTLLLNSAIVDTYLTAGTKLYAVRYSDPATQIKYGDGTELEAAKAYIERKISSEVAALGLQPSSEKLLELVSKYAIEYRYFVESYNKVETNYQPNSQVMAYMKQNKYVVDQAKEKLDQMIRENIEKNIKAFADDSGEIYSQVVSGITSSIGQQQSLRDSLVNNR